MKCWFEEINNGKMILNGLSKIVEDYWINIPGILQKI